MAALLVVYGRRRIGTTAPLRQVCLYQVPTLVCAAGTARPPSAVCVRAHGGERAEVTRLDRYPCLLQEVEKAPGRMGWNLQAPGDGAVCIENRRTIEPVKQGLIVDPAQQELQLCCGGDRRLLAKRPCATDHHHGVDHQPQTPPACH